MSPPTYIQVPTLCRSSPSSRPSTLFPLAVLSSPHSLITHIEHEPAIDLHLLVLVVLELQAAHILLHARDLGPVERRRLRVPREDQLADGVVGQDGVGRGDGDELGGVGFVDLAGRAVFVGFGVLDFVVAGARVR